MKKELNANTIENGKRQASEEKKNMLPAHARLKKKQTKANRMD